MKLLFEQELLLPIKIKTIPGRIEIDQKTITGREDFIMITIADLPRFIHELQIIANEEAP